jgi:two-component system, cell cycle response regulator
MNVLIAEDDLTSRIMLTALLKKWGYTVMATENGKQAWDILQKPDAPKLALLDWNMPEMDGIEVTQKVREMGAIEPAYIILLTARGEKSDLVNGLAAGASDYVSKPYDQDELRARLGVGRRMVELQQAIVQTAMHDPLTGVLNRGTVLELLQKEISRALRGAQHLAIGMLDIDHFKQINDTYGHLVGDDLLRDFSRVLQAHLRNSDHLGRFGGDEFLVITPGIASSDIENLFTRLCSTIAQTSFDTRAGKLAITISLGVAYLYHESEGDALLAVADAALYQAKHEGRNKVVYAWKTNPARPDGIGANPAAAGTLTQPGEEGK